MKKIYNKPTMILVKMETEHFIAASPGVYDQNQVRTDGSGSTGTHVGGTSSEGEVKITAMAVLPIWQNPTTPGQHGMNRRGNSP